MKNLIWRKWIDFLSPNEETSEISYEDKINGGNPGPILVGPMGVIPINEHNTPGKVFNFWIGHTNFDITHKAKNIIMNIPGVETLEIMTRYRFRIAIGQVFDELEVKDAIENALCTEENHSVTEPKSGVESFCAHLSKKYKYWAIFISPNGEIDYVYDVTKDGVSKKIKNHTNEVEVLTSWEKEDM